MGAGRGLRARARGARACSSHCRRARPVLRADEPDRLPGRDHRRPGAKRGRAHRGQRQSLRRADRRVLRVGRGSVARGVHGSPRPRAPVGRGRGADRPRPRHRRDLCDDDSPGQGSRVRGRVRAVTGGRSAPAVGTVTPVRGAGCGARASGTRPRGRDIRGAAPPVRRYDARAPIPVPDSRIPLRGRQTLERLPLPPRGGDWSAVGNDRSRYRPPRSRRGSRSGRYQCNDQRAGAKHC